MTISPEDLHLLIYAVITFLGIAGVYLKQHTDHLEAVATAKETNAKVDAQTLVINGQAAHVTAAANALATAALVANAQNQATQNQAAKNANLPAPITIPGDQ